MEVDFDSIINHCDFQINLLKNKRLTEIKEEAREYSRKIECNEYKTQEELIDVKNKVIKLKQEYNDIMNKNNDIKISINVTEEQKSNLDKKDDNNNEIKKLLEKRKIIYQNNNKNFNFNDNENKIKINKKSINDNKKEKKYFTNVNDDNERKKIFEKRKLRMLKKRNQNMDDNENDIKILSFNDFMNKLMYGNFENK